MRVRILQGKQTGEVQEVCQSEGENLLTTGFAEPVADAEGASLADPDKSDDAAIDPDPPAVPKARIRKPRAPKTSSASRRKRR